MRIVAVFCITFFSATVLSCIPCVGQQLLVISKNRVKARFNIGDRIYIAAEHHASGSLTITGFDKTSILSGSDTIPIYGIKRIGSFEKAKIGKLYQAGFKVLTAGVLLFIGDYLTVTLVQNNDYNVHPGTAIVSAALITSGVVMMAVNPRVTITRKNRAVIVSDDSPLYKR
jgi:hypothetical protein